MTAITKDFQSQEIEMYIEASWQAKLRESCVVLYNNMALQ